MHSRNWIIGSAGLVAAILCAGILATAAPRAAVAAPQAGMSPEVHELATQLAEEWLKERGVANPAQAPAAQQTGHSVDFLSSSAGAIHDQIIALARAAPDLPHEFERAAAQVAAVDADSGRAGFFLTWGYSGTGIWSRPGVSRRKARLF